MSEDAVQLVPAEIDFTKLDPDKYLPVEGRENHYRDAAAKHTMVCRPGQTPAELIAEIAAEAEAPEPPPAAPTVTALRAELEALNAKATGISAHLDRLAADSKA